MPFTLSDAETVLVLVRNFYKGQLKSSNKMYVDVSTPKRRTRNFNAWRSGHISTMHTARSAQLGDSTMAYGRYLARFHSMHSRAGITLT
jgi:hypothetical protein